jgi:hypothetical protein
MDNQQTSGDLATRFLRVVKHFRHRCCRGRFPCVDQPAMELPIKLTKKEKYMKTDKNIATTLNTTKARLTKLQSDLKTETDNLKSEFLNEIHTAAETFHLLQSLGVDMGEKSKEICSMFGIVPTAPAEVPTVKPTTTEKTGKFGEVKNATLELFKNGKQLTHSQVKEGLTKKLGREMGNQYGALAGLVTKGVLAKEGENYSLKKQTV